MLAYLAPLTFAAFVWWFATGAVLLLVGLAARFEGLRIVTAVASLGAGLYGLSASAGDISVGGAYMAFSATLLIWAAQEIGFLAGWITGPRPLPCPPRARGMQRLGYALAAIFYHELTLLGCGAAIFALTAGAPNQVAIWTFAALWTLRQSSKINLFLGVPVTNDALMPSPIAYLKSYFVRGPVGAFFTISVTLAVAVLAIMVQRLVETAVTPFEIAAWALVASLFALGIVEHWFMLLPLPALTLWGWGMKQQPSREDIMADQSVIDTAVPPRTEQDVRASGARQRLEDQFRQRFLEQRSPQALALGVEATTTRNGRS